MKFRTELTPRKASFTLDPSVPIVMAGSCFSQNIANKMRQHGWEACETFGTLYNPWSLCVAIDIMADAENGVQRFSNSLFQASGLWNSWYFDSSISSIHREDCISEFKLRQEMFLKALHHGKTLVVTFGTSICYHLKESGVRVANCHKQSADLFYTKRLGVSETSTMWDVCIDSLKKKFPELKIIFTVSPVRHLKDGFEGNSRSKAILLLTVEEICRYNPECCYFPAFELLNDDLRDYRFYASDLVHPSEEAIDYIWGKFLETFIDQIGRKYLEEGSVKFKAAGHRPKLGALGKPLCQ